MEGKVRSQPRRRSTAPSAFRGWPCFPYGGARRIRFRGFGRGSCGRLSPAPRALPNKGLPDPTPIPRGINWNRQPPVKPGGRADVSCLCPGLP